MSGFIKPFIYVIIVLLALTTTVFAQKYKDLEALKRENQKKIEKNKKEIEGLNKQMEHTSKDKQISIEQLTILAEKIKIRENNIHLLSSDINQITSEIEQNETNINHLENELKVLKDEYAKMLIYAYKNHNSYNKLLFVFSAESFNQAYKRLKFIQQYNEFRLKQVQLIIKTKTELVNQTQDLQQRKTSKVDLLSSKEVEKQTLGKEQSEKDNMVKLLEKKEKEIRTDLTKKQLISIRLKAELESIIEKEIKRAEDERRKKEEERRKKEEERLKAEELERKKAADLAAKKAAASKASDTKVGGGKTKTIAHPEPLHAEPIVVAKPVTKPTTDFSLTPEEAQLSSNFEANKGKLPWPVERGNITNTFGEHAHLVLKDIKVKNNGIDIETGPGSAVRAVQAGTVMAIIVIPGANKAIIIKHGLYFTVYSNLAEVNVQKGANVNSKDKIGKVYTDPAESKTELHFEIWKAKVLVDPALWLKR